MEFNEYLKVTVSAVGEIIADGQSVTPEQLATKLDELKKGGGAVLYHRESPVEEPHPNAMKVIALVTSNKLPIRFSSQPDFSDAVDDLGVSHPVGSLPDLSREPDARSPDARVYQHLLCGALTEISGGNFIRLVNPFALVGETVCCGCGKAVPIRQVVWVDTGENVAAYRSRLRSATPLMRRLFFSSLGTVVGR